MWMKWNSPAGHVLTRERLNMLKNFNRVNFDWYDSFKTEWMTFVVYGWLVGWMNVTQRILEHIWKNPICVVYTVMKRSNRGNSVTLARSLRIAKVIFFFQTRKITHSMFTCRATSYNCWPWPIMLFKKNPVCGEAGG